MLALHQLSPKGLQCSDSMSCNKSESSVGSPMGPEICIEAVLPLCQGDKGSLVVQLFYYGAKLLPCRGTCCNFVWSRNGVLTHSFLESSLDLPSRGDKLDANFLHSHLTTRNKWLYNNTSNLVARYLDCMCSTIDNMF